MWFFAPPRACTRLPFAVPRFVDVLGDRGGADEGDGLDRPGGRAARPRPPCHRGGR